MPGHRREYDDRGVGDRRGGFAHGPRLENPELVRVALEQLHCAVLAHAVDHGHVGYVEAIVGRRRIHVELDDLRSTSLNEHLVQDFQRGIAAVAMLVRHDELLAMGAPWGVEHNEQVVLMTLHQRRQRRVVDRGDILRRLWRRAPEVPLRMGLAGVEAGQGLAEVRRRTSPTRRVGGGERREHREREGWQAAHGLRRCCVGRVRAMLKSAEWCKTTCSRAEAQMA
mmetsp:Transcript_56859/g.164755  ORF Transcript_56859/g.164755 Transcript_56859/m.164755 type:complete len:225 (+) Transcript_56859:238-912(+)